MMPSIDREERLQMRQRGAAYVFAPNYLPAHFSDSMLPTELARSKTLTLVSRSVFKHPLLHLYGLNAPHVKPRSRTRDDRSRHRDCRGGRRHGIHDSLQLRDHRRHEIARGVKDLGCTIYSRQRTQRDSQEARKGGSSVVWTTVPTLDTSTDRNVPRLIF